MRHFSVLHERSQFIDYLLSYTTEILSVVFQDLLENASLSFRVLNVPTP